jgi:hypothetical protein
VCKRHGAGFAGGFPLVRFVLPQLIDKDFMGLKSPKRTMNYFAKSLSRFSIGVLEWLENFKKKVRADIERHRNEVQVANISKEIGECVVIISHRIIHYFHESDLSEVEISESWINANLNKLFGDTSSYTDIPYMRIYRRFRVMSRLNSWINTKEEVGCIEIFQGDASNKYLVVFPPADSTKFTIKKLK